MRTVFDALVKKGTNAIGSKPFVHNLCTDVDN